MNPVLFSITARYLYGSLARAAVWPAALLAGLNGVVVLSRSFFMIGALEDTVNIFNTVILLWIATLAASRLYSLHDYRQLLRRIDTDLDCRGRLLNYADISRGRFSGDGRLAGRYLESLKQTRLFSAGSLKLTRAGLLSGLPLMAGLVLMNIEPAVYNAARSVEYYMVEPVRHSFLKGSDIEVRLVLYPDQASLDAGQGALESWGSRRVSFHYQSDRVKSSRQIGPEGLVIPLAEDNFSFYFSIDYPGSLKAPFTTETVSIRLYDPAAITAASVMVQPPAYLKDILPAETQQGDLLCLRGSRLTWQATVNAAVGRATLQLKPGGQTQAKALEVPMTVDGYRLSVSRTATAGSLYSINAVDRRGNGLIGGAVYHLRVYDDRRPAAEIAGAGTEVDITRTGLLRLEILADDDFGLRTAWLLGINKKQVFFHRQFELSARSFRQKIEIDLTDHDHLLKRGTQIDFYLAVRDIHPATEDDLDRLKKDRLFPEEMPPYVFRNINGPGQWGVSGVFRLNYLTERQSFLRETKASRKNLTALKDITREEEERKAELTRLKEQVRSGRTFTAEHREKLKSLMKEEGRRTEKIKSLLKKFNDSDQDSPSNSRRAEELKKDLNDVVNNRIEKREKEYRQLLQKLGLNYKEAHRQIERLDDDNYLQKLQKSIANLENMLLERRLRRLHDDLTTLKERQLDLLKETPSAGRNEAQKEIGRRLAELEKKSRSLGLEAAAKRNKMTEELKEFSADPLWKSARQRAEAAAAEGNDEETQSGMMQESEESIDMLQKKSGRLLSKMQQVDLLRARSALQEHIYKFIELNRMMQAELNNLPADVHTTDKGLARQNDYRRSARFVIHMARRYDNQLNSLKNDEALLPILPPPLASAFELEKDSFKNLKESLERLQSGLVSLKSAELEKNINIHNSRLLKFSSRLKNMQGQQGKSARYGRQQQGRQQMGKAMKSLQKMAGRQGKGLSPGEKKWLDAMARELEKSASGKKQTGRQKQMKELARQIKKRDWKQIKKKSADLQKNLMRFSKAEQQRQEQKKERQAEKPVIEYTAPVETVMQKPAPSVKESFKRQSLRQYSPPRRKFYRTYMQNLERNFKSGQAAP